MRLCPPTKIIPVLGEQPHGLFHITHAVWRLYVDFIFACADAVGNAQVQRDPTVEEHNAVQHFFGIVVRACSEYLVELSDDVGGMPFERVDAFIEAAERNIDLAHLVHFLYDGGFLVLEFKNAVRRNSTQTLNRDWREFVTLGRSVAGHKTLYAPMAVMRIYWSVALKAPLAELCDATQTLPLSKHGGARNVGADMPVENLNRSIKADVAESNRSMESITDYCKTADFVRTVGDGMDALMYAKRKELKDSIHKAIDDDVRILKAFFRSKVGASWHEATQLRVRSELGVKDRAGVVPPWKAMLEPMYGDGADHYLQWVEHHVKSKAPWQVWRPGFLPAAYVPVYPRNVR